MKRGISAMSTETINSIREFIEANYLFHDDHAKLTDSQSLLETGLIDSTGVLELVAFLEQQIGITVADADIVPENLDSVQAIATFVDRKRNPAPAPAHVE